jgi:hypothetical protein
MNKIIYPNFSELDYSHDYTIYSEVLNKAKQEIMDAEDAYIINIMNNMFGYSIYDWEFSE